MFEYPVGIFPLGNNNFKPSMELLSLTRMCLSDFDYIDINCVWDKHIQDPFVSFVTVYFTLFEKKYSWKTVQHGLCRVITIPGDNLWVEENQWIHSSMVFIHGIINTTGVVLTPNAFLLCDTTHLNLYLAFGGTNVISLPGTPNTLHHSKRKLIPNRNYKKISFFHTLDL